MQNFASTIKTEYTSETIVEFNQEKYQFILTGNKGNLSVYAVMFFGIGLVFSAIFLPHIVKNWWITLIAFSIFALPFLLFGFRYFFMSRSNHTIIIDIKKQAIIYSETLKIPFSSIKQIYLTQLNFYDPERYGGFLKMEKIPSWQVTIEDFKGNEIILCKPEHKRQALFILEEFSRAMNVRIKKGIELL